MSLLSVGKVLDTWIAAIAESRSAAAATAEDRNPLPSGYELAREFDELIQRCPVPQSQGGGQYASALGVYTATKVLRPTVIIESGVFKGFSTWVLRQAAPAAHLKCFDPSLALRRYKDEQAEYVEADWTSTELDLEDPMTTLAYFDDHQNQCRRLQEAADHGIQWLFFDDDYALPQLSMDAAPAAPTIAMLMGPGGDWPEYIDLATRGGVRTVARAPANAAALRSVVGAYLPVPDLGGAFAYQRAHQSLVRVAVDLELI